MKVTPKALTVPSDSERREVSLVMTGLRIALRRSGAGFPADGAYRALGRLREPPKLSSFDRAAAATGRVRPV